MNKKTNKQMRTIWEANAELKEQSLGWKLSYNKMNDTVFFGEDCPEGTFYVNAGDGMMVRVDANNRIYGFAIENATHFIQRNSEFAPLVLVMHPIKSRIFYAVYKTIIRPTAGLVQNISTISQNYLAGKAVYAN